MILTIKAFGGDARAEVELLVQALVDKFPEAIVSHSPSLDLQAYLHQYHGGPLVDKVIVAIPSQPKAEPEA